MNTNDNGQPADNAAGHDLFDHQTRNCENGIHHGPPSPQPASPAGHNSRIAAKKLCKLAEVHERRHLSDQDREVHSTRAGEPHMWLPFPVLVAGGWYELVDGYGLIESICEIDENTLVEFRVVDLEEALKIRSQNLVKPLPREPMARARQALYLSKVGWTYQQIAKEVRLPENPNRKGVSEARISQMCKAARAEEMFPKLASIITDPARIPPKFWEGMAAKRSSLEKRDENTPLPDGATWAGRFDAKVHSLIAELTDCKIAKDHDAIAADLDFASPTKDKGRNRHFGKKHPIPGTNEHLGFAQDRTGGAAISLPQNLSKDETKTVFAVIMAEVSRLLNNRPGTGSN